MRRSFLALAPLAALLAAPPADAEPRIEPGEWEQVMTMDTGKSGHGEMKQTQRACLTSGDVEIFTDRERWAQEMLGSNPQAQCKLQDSKEEGTTITVTLACEGGVVLTVRHDFQPRSGTIVAETRVNGELQGSNRIESRKVADTCSPATIERWKQQNPGKTFAP